MMREILFRGKRLEIGDWVEGSLIAYPDGDCYIARPSGDPNVLDKFAADPATVGQYTGLKDKHGERIFEGDIVRILGDQTNEDWKCVDYTALIAFIDGGFCALDGTVEEHGFRRYALARMDFDLEIIGNIHDNPELLGGNDNG